MIVYKLQHFRARR